MNKSKLRIGIIFGGKSAEHEVSLQSAKNVIEALDRAKYEPVLIGVDKMGKWHLTDPSNFLLRANNPKEIALNKSTKAVAIVPDSPDQQLVMLTKAKAPTALDVIFPILHGPFGEDGTVQGLLKLLDVPFVGPSVLGSAVAMDKDVSKRLFQMAKLPVGKYLVFSNPAEVNFANAKKVLGLPIFVKPANMGSSVGVSKVMTAKELTAAVALAFRYDRKILLEAAIEGREIEVAILGNEKPIASVPGEIVPTTDFYSYEAKYIDEQGARLHIPARLTPSQIRVVQKLAIAAFKTLGLEGMARIDFFMTKRGQFYINEANTIPGFTNVSMYPKLWEASGLSYPKLIDTLIQLARERYAKERRLKTNH